MNNFLRFCLFLVFCIAVMAPAHAQNYQFLDDEAEPQFNLSFGLQATGAGGLTVVFDYRDEGNYYALDVSSNTIDLRSVVAGNSRRLGSRELNGNLPKQVTLKRRPWLMQVIADRQVVLTAYDANFDSGKIGMTAKAGWAWNEPRVQPVEEIYFADDFTRTMAEENQWKAASGKWELTASTEKISAKNAEMSANPFSYKVDAATTPALMQVGRWFWGDYDAQVSVRPTTRGAVGIAANVQDAGNYVAFVWSSTGDTTARQLIRFVDGKATVLDSQPGAFLPRQWYRLGLRTSPGYVEAFIDGKQVLKARDDHFGQGGIALVARDKAQANFDDVLVRSNSFYRQDFAATENGAWSATGGQWQAKHGILTSTATPNNGDARLFLAGRNDWSGYELTAAATTGDAGAGGVVLGYRSEKDYAVFRWAGPQSTLPYRGRRQLVRVRDGNATVVSDEPAKLTEKDAAADYIPIRARLNAGLATIYHGAEIIAQVADESLSAGRVALYAAGDAPVTFRDVVLFFPPAPLPPRVASKMESDALMAAWASQKGEWPPVMGALDIEFWNPSDFFGDGALEYPWRRNSDKPGTLEIALRAQRENFSSGYIVRSEAQAQPPGIQLTILRGDETLKKTSVAWKDIDPNLAPTGTLPLRVALEGRTILVSLADKPVLSYLDTNPGGMPAGTGIGARSKGVSVRTKDIKVVNTNRDDFTFTEAPTAWYAPQGKWAVASRWPCTSDWSFFGGAGLNPVLWTKREYRGDTVVEMYVHNQMDLAKEIGYSNPGNLNLTIGGDGKNPSSGYSFVVAGWSYTRNAIWKGDKVVAQNMAADARFPLPVNHNPMWHNRWSYIRAEARRATKDGRQGVQLSLVLDDEPLLQYFDADPLPSIANGGRVALWTIDSMLMVARAKIASTQPGEASLPSNLPDAGEEADGATSTNIPAGQLFPHPIFMDGMATTLVNHSAGAAGPADSHWLLRNPVAGGHFAVTLKQAAPEGKSPGTTRLTSKSRLEMDVAIPGNVKVDLYVTIGGVRHLVEVSGGQLPDARLRKIGAATLAAPDAAGWRHLSFDLGTALAKIYANQQLWEAEAIEIGALHGDEYRWLGFGGNPLGAEYRLRNIKLTE